MKKVILLFVLTVSVFAYSQDSTKVQDCKFRINEVDDFTGTSKKVVEADMLISHTDSTLLKYYKNKKHQYTELGIYCGKINDSYVAYFSWRIDTENAYKYYGLIVSDAKFMIKFTDGTTATLNFAKTEGGDTNFDMKYTTYSNYCLLSDDLLADLKTKKIEKVRMYWSEGYQDYPVVNSTLFISQLKCLSK
jgi:hypothetical protein